MNQLRRNYAKVALRKESVDRNFQPPRGVQVIPLSLSARRAWIEIARHTAHACGVVVALRKESVDRNSAAAALTAVKSVALRKESVDRNHGLFMQRLFPPRSLSARRAWIEIKIWP